MEEELEHNTFILFWDCYGLEACHDLTGKLEAVARVERENLFERIKHPDREPHNSAMQEISQLIQFASLRARMNPQRNYELYMITTDVEITREQLVSAFEENPNDTAELVRNRGRVLFSHRNSEPERVIK